MTITDVSGNIVDGTTLVTFQINPDKEQGLQGFVQVDSYSVNAQASPLTWVKLGEVTLNRDRGGVKGARCLMGVCAPRNDLKLSAVVSFCRAPGLGVDPNLPNSPFAGPNPRRMPLTHCTSRLLKGGEHNEDVFFYPILARLDAEGNIVEGEEFVEGGNFFYTICVHDEDSKKFFVCDPEMEIDPVN